MNEEDGGISISLDELRDPSVMFLEQDALPYIEGTDDPFVSAEDSSAPREESLALSLTRKVMELHGGTLDVVRAECGVPGHTAAATGMRIGMHFPAARVIR